MFHSARLHQHSGGAAQDVIQRQFVEAKAEDGKWIARAQAVGMGYIVPIASETQVWTTRVRETAWPQADVRLGEGIMATSGKSPSSESN